MTTVKTTEQRLYGATEDGAALLDLHPAFGSASRAIDLVAPGVYEGLRTFGGSRLFGLRGHLERLRRSIAGYRKPLQYEEEALVRALSFASKDAAAAFGCEARLRVDVAAEPASVLGCDSNLLIAASAFPGLPPHVVRDGAYLRSVPGLRRPDPLVKTSDFVPLREAWIVAHGDADAYEHLMVDAQGNVLECTQSNLVLVADGALHTPPDGILPGVTLRAVCDLAREEGIDVREVRVPLSDVGDFDEAFMTTSVRSVVPVSRIDEFRFNIVGPVTRRLAERYDALAREDAVEPERFAEARY